MNAVNDPGYSAYVSTGLSQGLVLSGLLLDLESSNYSGGGSWADSSLNSNVATLSNGTGCNVNSYAFLNGLTNFTVPSVGNLSTFTVSAWYNQLDNSESYTGIIDSGYYFNEGTGIQNYFLGNGSLANQYAGGYATTNLGNQYSGNVPLNFYTWNNITTTFNGSDIKTYINNNLIETMTQVPDVTLVSADYLFIGGGNPSLASRRVTGLLGEALIYDRPLSSNEVSRNYAATLGQYPQNQLGISIDTNTSSLTVVYNSQPRPDILYWGDRTINSASNGIFTRVYADASRKIATLMTTANNLANITITGDSSNVLNTLIFNQNTPNDTLYIDQFNGISSLVIPNTTLYVRFNTVTNINSSVYTSFPPTVNNIEFINNNFTSVPLLSTTITNYLYFDNNPLTDFTNVLPTLPSIYILNAGLTSVPVLPSSILTLGLDSNALTDFTNIQPTLTTFRIKGCSLTSVPVLPSTILTLYMDNNALTDFTNIQPTLTTLGINNCGLTSAPVLPSSVINIDALTNPMSDLTNFSSPYYVALNLRSIDITQANAEAFATNLPTAFYYNNQIAIRTTLSPPLDFTTQPFIDASTRGWNIGD